ncbi:MAG: 2-oxoacid:acceptor oxidoreductase family protein [Clostridia bacterium]|jgi:2-oxoglutarate ferredoxin oxidoreductase subunit gamma|nr:2-oxoacid:ferredoxin oxidoreductase subunit gamma [Clostridiaceae bacterium]
MEQKIIIAGFGGQGILSAGRFLAYAGMLEDKNVSWLPSYGPEMRGGTANCCIIISDEQVGSPIVNDPTALIAMNTPSLDKFEKIVRPGGVIIVDSSLVGRQVNREDVVTYAIPATELASEAGNATFANIFLLGKLIAHTNIIKPESFELSLKHGLREKYHHLIPEEMKVLRRGMEY